MFFWPSIATIIAAFLKKDCSYRKNCGFQFCDADLKHSLTKEKKYICLYVLLPVFMFRSSRFILKIQIRVCFRDVLQPVV